MAPLQENSPPTQQQVAERAGVSQETVSHILNGARGKRYSAATKEKVRQAALEIGYVPNRASRSMRMGRSNLIAVIHFGSPYRTGQDAVSYLPLAITSKGYDYLVNDLQWHGNEPDRVVSDLIQFRVEGVILVANTANRLTAAHIKKLADAGIPTVSLYGDDNLSMIPLISGDVLDRTSRLTDHLLGVGHRRILMPVSGLDTRNTVERIAGFRKAFERKGTTETLTEEEFFSGDPIWQSPNAGQTQGVIVRMDTRRYRGDVTRLHYELVLRLGQHERLPDALMSANDQGAFGVFAAALEMGLKIPDDLAVVGVDNDSFGGYPAFQLTTTQGDNSGACEAAVSTLLDLIHRNPESIETRKVLASELIIRASCGSKMKPLPHIP